jgi:glycosyltransferase involved in cell wall biosynthesis
MLPRHRPPAEADAAVRIAFVTPEYPSEQYYSGGLAQYSQRVACALAARGHEVHVFLLSDTAGDEIRQGVHLHRIAVKRGDTLLEGLSRGRLRDTLAALRFGRAVFKRLCAAAPPFDVVQVSNYRGAGLPLLRGSLRHRVVTRISSFRPAWNALSQAPRTLDALATEWIEGMQIRRSHHVYAPSQRLRDLLAEQGMYGVSLIRPPFYLETEECDPRVYEQHLAGRNYLLFAGRFQLHKGVHILAEALPEAMAEHRDLYACFVGVDRKTALAPSMRDYARERAGAAANRLIFLDQTPHAQLYPIMAHARLVVLPSLMDNLPNTCLEAMALGRPVIGTRGASFEELIEEGVSGFLVPPGDVKALAQAIVTAWTRVDLAEIGARARDKVAEFAPDKTLPVLEAFFQRVAAGC